jgi:urea transporter
VSSQQWKDFADALFRGWAAVFFSTSPVLGAVILLLVFINPWAGSTALLASAAATLTALWLRTDPTLLKSGVLGINAVLVGLVATWYVPSHPTLLPIVALAAATTVPLTCLWINRVGWKTRLPTLTLPFLLTSWFLFLAFRPLEPATISSFYYYFNWSREMEAWVWDLLPENVILFFRSMSWLLFQDSAVLGIASLAVLLWRSRITALMAFLGFMVGLVTFRAVYGGLEAELPFIGMQAGFNTALIAVCLGGLFLHPTRWAYLLALAAASGGALLVGLLARPFEAAQLPLLNGPFLAVTLGVLLLAHARRLNLPKARIIPVPLEAVSTPEALLEWEQRSKAGDSLQLTLPFYGIWYVSQGPHGLLTHWGNSSYAWDFIVLDSHSKSCRGLGRQADDYFAFGLPVTAPAPGRIIKVRDTVPDNVPPEVNTKERWGNYVLIDHGGGFLSELSHFQYKGIIVKEGAVVQRGQALGFVGNSGLSMEPHLHYQLQTTPELGARTVPAKFWGYYHHNGSKPAYVTKGSPQQGEFVSNTSAPTPYSNNHHS